MKKIVGIAGWSGSGKTTIMEGLIKIFKNKYNLKVCALKHAHKNFSIDKEGKDSFKFSKAGADKVIISSEKQWAVISNDYNKERKLEDLIKTSSNVDIVLIEGWKFSNIKKIEIHRRELNKEILCLKDNNILAIASNDLNIDIDKNICRLDINNHESIANFIIENNFN